MVLPRLVREGWRRAALFAELRDPDRPPHVGVLLDNVPDYLFWLAAGALSGTVVVGINSTYRGEQLAQLIDHTDCQALVTSSDLAGLLDGAPHTVPAERVLVVDDPGFTARARRRRSRSPTTRRRRPTTTSSCSSSRPGRPGCRRRCAAPRAGSGAPAPTSPASPSSPTTTSSTRRSPSSTPPRCSRAGRPPSTPGPRSRPGGGSPRRAPCPTSARFGATFLTYTGKVLNYMLSVPEAPDDATVPLRLAIGNEASEHDIKDFARRFGCHVRDSYGSTEGVIIIRRDPSMPAGRARHRQRLGEGARPRDRRGVPSRRSSTTAVGSRTSTRPSARSSRPQPASGFEGYYRNEAATERAVPRRRLLVGRPRLPRRRRLAVLRRPVERVAAGRRRELRGRPGRGDHRPPPRRPLGGGLRRARRSGRRPGDGRRSSCADGATFDPAAFDAFLGRQPDLGPKWVPAFVRVDAELPKLSSMKVDKKVLRSDAWQVDGVVWRPATGRGPAAAHRRRPRGAGPPAHGRDGRVRSRQGGS